MGPLLHYCADPELAADRVADAPQVDLAAAPRRRARDAREVSLLAPAPPPTPIWHLPARAVTYVRIGGAPRLWQEMRSYVRWLRIRSGR